MWPFKKTQFAGPEQLPAVIDPLIERLRRCECVSEAENLHAWAHEIAWTTSNEFYGEVKLILQKLCKERRDLPPDVAGEVDRLIKSIDRICRWR